LFLKLHPAAIRSDIATDRRWLRALCAKTSQMRTPQGNAHGPMKVADIVVS
jgi:hypothetical protein